MKPFARVMSAKIKGDKCPQCHRQLDGFTHLSMEELARDITGQVTMCAYCTAELVFVDNTGKLRLMTDEERPRFAPEIEMLLQDVRKRAQARADGYTKKYGSAETPRS